MDYIIELKFLYWLILLVFYFSVVINFVTIKTHSIILKRSTIFCAVMLLLVRTNVFDSIKKYYEQGYGNIKAVELFEVLVPFAILLVLIAYSSYTIFKMAKIKGIQKFYLTVKDYDSFENKINEYNENGIFVRYEDNYDENGEYKNTKVIFSNSSYKKSIEYIRNLKNEYNKRNVQLYKVLTTVAIIAVFDFWLLSARLASNDFGNLFDVLKNVL